ncbi:PhnA-like protein [Rhodoligotrophos ferricapiens]|uniref:PhnA-like protein n=1 Tax=Rhodoligotrophos ferricapiens TaxID=3069264 RepID=UPI00315C6F1C
MTYADPTTPRSLGDHDAAHISPVTPGEDFRSVLINRVSWGAVLAGVVISLVVHLLLNLLGLGVGASTLDPGTGDNPAVSTLSIGAGIWWTIAGIIAALVGGYAAGRLCGRPKESTAAWHGLTTWALTTLIIFYLLTSTIGGVVGGAFNTLSSAAGELGKTAAEVAQTAAPALANNADPFGSIEQSIRGASGGNDPAALRDATVSSVRAALTGDQAQAQDARERAAQAIARAQNIPIEQARTQVQQYEQQYTQAVDQAKQKATEAADVAAKSVSRGAIFSFIALVLGGIAAWFGGRMGTIDPTITKVSGRMR